jgi:hypothetical protein
MVRRSYNWPGLTSSAALFVRSCNACQKSKASRSKPAGPITPLPVPDSPWLSISWDYIGPLPESGGFNAILVVVDCYTKMAHFVPAPTSHNSRTLAQHFLHRVVRPHGFPSSIVSNRGATFSSEWWRDFALSVGTRLDLSTLFHPRTDGQTKRTNITVKHMLHCYTDYLQTDWSDKLPMAEFAYNNSPHSSIGQSPFHALYGYDPQRPCCNLPNLRARPGCRQPACCAG